MSAPAHADAHGASHGAAHAHHEPNFFFKYLWSTDHKIIGFQYMFTGMALALVGAFMAYVFRMQLAFPGQVVPGWGMEIARGGRYDDIGRVFGRARPAVGFSAPATTLAKVVLPEPLVPMTPKVWPGSRAKATPRSWGASVSG